VNAFATSTTVKEQGQIHLAGVPFAPGTEVEVTISLKARTEEAVTAPDDAELIAARERMRELFAAITGFRNSPRIPREALYERGRVH
jgi:hypothetical protein